MNGPRKSSRLSRNDEEEDPPPSSPNVDNISSGRINNSRGSQLSNADALHSVRGSARLRTKDTDKPSYVEVDSDADRTSYRRNGRQSQQQSRRGGNYQKGGRGYGNDDEEEEEEEEEEVDDEEPTEVRRSSRSRSSGTANASNDKNRNEQKSVGDDVFEAIEGQRLTRNMRKELGGTNDNNRGNNSNGQRDDRKRGRQDESNNTYSKRARGSAKSYLSSSSSEEEEEEDDEEEAGVRKYSFRDRMATRRETMNVATLGGDGGGMSHSGRSKTYKTYTGTAQHDYGRNLGSSNLRDHGRNYVDSQSRLHLGGKMPAFGARERDRRDRLRERERRRHRSGGSSHRRHFDSSSDSSSDSSDDDRRKSRNRGRSGHRSDSSADGEDGHFRNYENRRLQNELASIMPLRGLDHSGDSGFDGMAGSTIDKQSKRDIIRADVMPVGVDQSVGFSAVGGLDRHVQALKEMVVLPLLYPDVFTRFDTQPPRGVLFVGPPGTGKTLTARSLANSISASASQGGKKVSFFMRKGADCLSKWVGEGERQLRLLFEQAKRYQPSIIFFDEIDGLAPVRSVKQDQIHASIVSTLLALMDGLDSRGQVVVIGATNRPDAIDPALRRPGRFDRELLFPLPDRGGRRAILDIHTSKWIPPLDNDVKNWIVDSTAGYCGADIKAFCAEAALAALRRAYPQIYDSASRLQLDPTKLVLTRGDFAVALQKIIPSARRSTATVGVPLDPLLAPLLQPSLDYIMTSVRRVFPYAGNNAFTLDTDCVISNGSSSANTNSNGGINNASLDPDSWVAALTNVQDLDHLHSHVEHLIGHSCQFGSSGQTKLSGAVGDADGSVYQKLIGSGSNLWDRRSITFLPAIMLTGPDTYMATLLGLATMHCLEGLPCFSIDFPSLLADPGAASPEQALVHRVQEAIKASPSVIYLPNFNSWWRSSSDAMKSALAGMMESTPPNHAVLWLSSSCSVEANESGQKEQGRDHDQDEEEDPRLAYVTRWLSGESDDSRSSCNGLVTLHAPGHFERRAFWDGLFSTLAVLPAQIYAARKINLLAQTQQLEVDTPQPVESVALAGSASTRARSSSPSKRPTGGAAGALDSHDDPVAERDSYHMRELRNFLRLSLHELGKDKRTHAFSRPVEPDAVPDYYDVVTCPMDLETMRAKVDDGLYPSLDHFLRDIDQIVFNAKEYNPRTYKDKRGRAIVASAHIIGDMVESHAYRFKKEVGYDLFRRCEDICRRQGITLPPPPQSGDRIPEDNEAFYLDILEDHEALKREMGDEHPSVVRLREEEEEAAAAYKKADSKGGDDQEVIDLVEEGGDDSRADSDDEDAAKARRYTRKSSSPSTRLLTHATFESRFVSELKSRRGNESKARLGFLIRAGFDESNTGMIGGRSTRRSQGPVDDTDLYSIIDNLKPRLKRKDKDEKEGGKLKAAGDEDEQDGADVTTSGDQPGGNPSDLPDSASTLGVSSPSQSAAVSSMDVDLADLNTTNATITTTITASGIASSTIVTIPATALAKITPVLTPEDIDNQCPELIAAMHTALAQQSSGEIKRWCDAFTAGSAAWSVPTMLAAMTKLNRWVREFSETGQWDVLCGRIREEVESMQ